MTNKINISHMSLIPIKLFFSLLLSFVILFFLFGFLCGAHQAELSLYNEVMMYECLPCAEGCDFCKDASPCVAALNWPMRTGILVMACTIIGFLPPAALFTFKYQQVKVSRKGRVAEVGNLITLFRVQETLPYTYC